VKIGTRALRRIRQRRWTAHVAASESGLRELAARSEYPVHKRTALWVTRSHYAVGHSLGRVVFRLRTATEPVEWSSSVLSSGFALAKGSDNAT
jgi:hypothetical protein